MRPDIMNSSLFFLTNTIVLGSNGGTPIRNDTRVLLKRNVFVCMISFFFFSKIKKLSRQDYNFILNNFVSI